VLRILQVSDAYYPFPGGVTEHLHHLTLSLRRRGHDVQILTGRYPGSAALEDPPWVHRVGRVHILPPLPLLNATQLTLTFTPGLPLEVRAFFRDHTFDLIHTHGPFALNLPFLALHYGSIPQVATFHTAFVGWNWNRIAKVVFRFWSRKIHTFIAVSEVAKDAMASHYPGRYRIIPNGVDVHRFTPEGPMPSDPFSRPILLFVGRMEPRKGFPYALRAFQELKRRIPTATLVAIGTGRLLETYRQMVPSELRDAVHFLGFVEPDRLPQYYRWADVYTSPAIGGETFGIVLLEAMACGTPVVAADIPGYRQVIQHGRNGLLVNVRDPKTYAEALWNVLEDERFRAQLIEEGLKTAMAHAWDRIAEQIEALYKEVLQGS